MSFDKFPIKTFDNRSHGSGSHGSGQQIIGSVRGHPAYLKARSTFLHSSPRSTSVDAKSQGHPFCVMLPGVFTCHPARIVRDIHCLATKKKRCNMGR